MNKAVISGTGTYVPGEPISNSEVCSLADIKFDTEKLAAKTGIRYRHIAHLRGIDETTADFSTKAAASAIEAAGLTPDDIDLFIVGTDTPEYISPATAILVQGRLQKGEHNCGAFDVASSCASFTSALDVGARMVAYDPEIKHAVIVGVYNMPAFFRPGDAFGYSIFADGAGAVVLSKTDDKSDSGYITGHRLADGTQWNYIGVYSGGARQPITHERLEAEEWGLQLLNRLPGDRNVKLWPSFTEHLAAKAGLRLDDIDHFIFTQINASVIREVMKVLGQPENKALMIMDKYGYTGSGCVPMALDDGIKSGRVKKGDVVLTVASGAGLSVAGNIIRI
ncbi:MAG: ketoacyl-ACP synthase III [Spirochaetales bacterium]|nr:ketoacyl-ACP synthase III [Spirochaetales bacterium]